MSAITTEDVYEVLQPIWLTKKETAGRVRGRIERIMAYAKVMKLCAGDNPATLKNNLDQLLPNQSKSAVHHAAMPYAKVPAFVAELRTEREGVAARALEFTILTAVRTNEVTQARWRDIDLDAAVWTIPREAMKKKDASRPPHQVPLSEPTLALLRALPRLDDAEFVFPSPDTGGPISNAAMDALLKRMGLKGQATVHGFRSSFKDWSLEQTSYPDAVSEAALDHIEADKVKAAYKRTTFLQLRTQLMTDYGAFVDGRAVPVAGNVVSLRAAP